MKKIRLFFLMLLFVVSGCNFNDSEKIFLSFEKAENVVLENIHFLLNENDLFFQFQNYSVRCDIDSDDENMKLDSNIYFSGFLDTEKNEMLDLYPNVYFFDKKKFAEISISGLIQNLYHENKYYTNFSGFMVDLGKGNYKSNLWYMIVDNLSGKWINYDSMKFDNIRDIQKDIKFLLNTISSSSTFENIEQVSYEGYTAYKITLKDDVLDFIKNQTNIEISGFDGLFIIRSNDQVDLRINNMQIIYENNFGKKMFTVNGIMGEDDGVFNFLKDDENIEISYEMHKKYTKINISKIINFNQIWNFGINISKSQKDDINKINIKGGVQISPIVIYGSDLEKQLEINIKCLYENFGGEDLEMMVKEPDSYILLDQILGDEFSIKNFIGNK